MSTLRGCNDPAVHSIHLLTLLACSTFAPRDTNSLTTATWPFPAACISAVQPRCTEHRNDGWRGGGSAHRHSGQCIRKIRKSYGTRVSGVPNRGNANYGCFDYVKKTSFCNALILINVNVTINFSITVMAIVIASINVIVILIVGINKTVITTAHNPYRDCVLSPFILILLLFTVVLVLLCRRRKNNCFA